MSKSDHTTTSIGFSGALFLLFLGLRLTDNIDWAWYWVAAPLWMPLGVILVAALGVGVAILVAYALDKMAARRRRRARAAMNAVHK